MKPKPNSSDISPDHSSTVREDTMPYPAPVDLPTISANDELPDHAEPSMAQQLRHARMLLDLETVTADERLRLRRQ